MNTAISVRPIRIAGTGIALPDQCLGSAELDRRLGLPAGSVEARTGVRQRYVESGHAAALAARAARAALAAAGIEASALDAVLCASATADQEIPCNAVLLQAELGLTDHGSAAFDLNASCLGFLVGLDVVAALLAAGRFRRVLLACCDIASCGLDWSSLDASGIFGDGAAAVVLERVDGPVDAGTPGLLAFAMQTFSRGAHDCEIPAGGSRFHPSRVPEQIQALARFRMDREAVFKLASRKLPPVLDAVLAQAGVTLADIACVVPHQASHLGLEHLRRRLKLPEDKFIDIYADHGNQVSASLPSALHHAIRSGRLQRGELALLLGTGAGLSVAGAVLRY